MKDAQQPQFIALAAMAENRVIGKDGVLPWHLPEDLKWFKRTTLNHAILFGRTTFEGLKKPLPKRRNLILSRSLSPQEGVEVISHPNQLEALGEDVIYICGGAEVYRQFLDRCETLLLTRVKGEYEGDTFFPKFEDNFQMSEIIEEGEQYQIERHDRKNK